jgi:phenylacetate-CoA ligase
MDVKTILRLMPLYRKTLSNISCADEGNLFKHLKDIENDVHYYRDKCLSTTAFEDIPILRKADISGHENEFVSNKYPSYLLKKSSTGGTSGISLNIYKSYKDIVKELAFVDYAFALIDNNLKLAVLRGNKPSKGIYSKRNGSLILSSYDLSEDTIDLYVKAINDNAINCIHAYPSSILIFLKLVENKNLTSKLNGLKGILTSSEVITKQDKIYIKNVLPSIRLIDLYGQNEHVAFATSLDLEPYQFYYNYGYTEFIPADDIYKEEKVYEIVSTGFNNDAMPLVRYGTEDFVEINDNGDVISIRGRQQEYIYDYNSEMLPCMILTRPHTLKNVLSFQFFQEKYGEVEFRLVVNSKFNDIDRKELLIDCKSTYNNRLKVKLVVVDSLIRTKAGKVKRLIQKI